MTGSTVESLENSVIRMTHLGFQSAMHAKREFPAMGVATLTKQMRARGQQQECGMPPDHDDLVILSHKPMRNPRQDHQFSQITESWAPRVKRTLLEPMVLWPSAPLPGKANVPNLGAVAAAVVMA